MTSRLALEDRAVSAYLGMALGDALGATVEFLTPREIVHQYKIHNKITGGGWLHLKAGQITDDTEMSLALGNAILEVEDVQAEVIGRYFSDWMASKPVDIGNTVRRGIVGFRNKGTLAVPKNEFDGGNGACMRSLPVALFGLGGDEDQLAQYSQTQSWLTHHNDQSDAGTLCVMKMVQAGIMGEHPGSFAVALQEQDRAFSYIGKKMENPSGYIVDTLKAVFQAFCETQSFEACLIDVVNRGGDADTTGAIAGMIAGAYYGPDQLPKKWLKKLDPEIRVLCRDQAQALIRLSPLYRSLP